METEYLHARLCVWIVRWFELQLGDSQFFEKLGNHTDEIAQCQIAIGHHTFNLVEFSQMCGVQRLIAEYTIDTEVFGGCETALLVCQLVQHACTDGCSVSAQQILLSLF